MACLQSIRREPYEQVWTVDRSSILVAKNGGSLTTRCALFAFLLLIRSIHEVHDDKQSDEEDHTDDDDLELARLRRLANATC